MDSPGSGWPKWVIQKKENFNLKRNFTTDGMELIIIIIIFKLLTSQGIISAILSQGRPIRRQK